MKSKLLSLLLLVTYCIYSPISSKALPVLGEGGLANAAGILPPILPGGRLAQGALFSGFGVEIGPTEFAQATSLPLPTELGGVTVTVTAGEVTADAFLVFVSERQFNAIMPSDIPAGPAEIRVTFNGETSAPVSIVVVRSTFGIFSVAASGVGPGIVTNFVSAAEQPLNTSTMPARPGQFVVIWGTGLLGIPGADDRRPVDVGAVRDLRADVDVSVLLGGVPVSVILYAGRSAEFPGLDQITIQIPEETFEGCFVPLVVVLNGIPSNEVRIAVSSDGQPCSDALNPFSAPLVHGSRLGVLANVRVAGNVALGEIGLNFTLDVFAGSFSDQPGGLAPYNRFFALPPLGSCSRQDFRGINLVGLFAGNFPDLDFGPELDAGPELLLNKNGAEPRTIEQDPASVGRYVSTVGGGLSLFGTPPPPYYDVASYMVTSEGGNDVGPIAAQFDLPARPTWTNQEDLRNQALDRSQGIRFSWGVNDGTEEQIMVVLAANVLVESGAASGFVCLLPQSLGEFTASAAVASYVLPSTPDTEIGTPTSLGFVGVGSLPPVAIELFQAEGLDAGAVLTATIGIQSASFE